MDRDELKSQIIITNTPQETLEELIKSLGTSNYRIFDKEDFLIEDAHELIAHAYIASEGVKYLIVKALSFNNVSQNALLKLLEEPPLNIVVIFIAPGKSIFLPTVRSRLPITMRMSQKEELEVKLDFETLNLKSAFEFLKESRYLPKREAKAFIERAFDYYKMLPLSDETKLSSELEEFDRSFRLIELNSPTLNIISDILLLLLEKKSAVQTLR